MEDPETPLIMSTAPPRYRDECLNAISKVISRCQLMCLVLAWIVSALLGFVLVLLVLFQFTTLKPVEPNLNSAVISSFNVSKGFDELYGTWDMTLDLNKDIQYFKYKVKAWVYSDGEFVSVTKLKGQESLLQGTFTADIEENFSRDQGLSFDLFVEAEVTVFSLFRRAKKTVLMIDCCGLYIEFPLDKTTKIGTLLNGAKSCKVRTSPTKLVALESM